MAANAAGARAWFEEQDKAGLELERSESNKTGFLDVNKVRGGYQVKAWDRKLKRARGLPGVWSSAEEAAQFLACAKRMGMQEWFFDALGPPAQRKQRGSAGVPACPARTCTLASPQWLVCSDLVSPVAKINPAKKKPRGKPFPKKHQQPASPPAGQSLEDLGPNSTPCARVMGTVMEVLPMSTQLSPRSLQARKRVQVLQNVPA